MAITARAKEIERLVLDEGYLLRFNLSMVIQVAIDAAVAEEREACLQLVRRADTEVSAQCGIIGPHLCPHVRDILGPQYIAHPQGSSIRGIIAAIRARGKTP